MSISGLDFKTKVISLNDVLESVQLWDTAGQERFRKVTQTYMSKVHGIILAYDITSEESFKHLHRWMTYIQVKVACLNMGEGDVGDVYDMSEICVR